MTAEFLGRIRDSIEKAKRVEVLLQRIADIGIYGDEFESAVDQAASSIDSLVDSWNKAGEAYERETKK
jgi:uncharacterized protein YukE